MIYTDKFYVDSKLLLCNYMTLTIEMEMLKSRMKNKFTVDLINGDIYQQPILDHMNPTLRLMLDKELGYGNLPIKKDERIQQIGFLFNEILIELKGKSIYSKYENATLSVDYIDYNYLRFLECYHTVPSYLRQSLHDIESVYRYNNKIYLVYLTDGISESRELVKFKGEVLSKVMDIIRSNGYDGEYLKNISIEIVSKNEIVRAGGFRNYMR